MKTIKVSGLTGAALDWAVAKCEGATDFWFDTVATHWVKLDGKERALSKGWTQSYQPSTDWSQGGPIIEREGVDICTSTHGGWIATLLIDCEDSEVVRGEGETVLVAAMRCYVASKLGDVVEIPEELI